MSDSKLNASCGAVIQFTANGVAIDAIVVDSSDGDAMFANIVVETDLAIPRNAQLKIPALPEAGGCGLARPQDAGNGKTRLTLCVGYSHLDVSTLGK
jgi:hypothetical protein